MSFFTNQLPGNYCGSAGGYSAWQIAGRGHADPQAGTLPANDGGYLVGAMASQPGLFASDGMGTANALEALLTRARALGLSVHLTDPFCETDVAADLNQQMIGILAELDKPKLSWSGRCALVHAPTALRPEECFALQWRDIDYQKTAVAARVIAKEDRSGKVPGSNQNRCKKAGEQSRKTKTLAK